MTMVKIKHIKASKIGLSALIIIISLLSLTSQQITQKDRPFNKTYYTLAIKKFLPLARRVKDKKIFMQQVLDDTIYAYIDGLRIVYYSLAATENKSNKKDTFWQSYVDKSYVLHYLIILEKSQRTDEIKVSYLKYRNLAWFLIFMIAFTACLSIYSIYKYGTYWNWTEVKLN